MTVQIRFENYYRIVVCQAEEELDRLSKTMGYMEKGKIRVKGLLEPEAGEAPMPATPPAMEEAAPQETEA